MTLTIVDLGCGNIGSVAIAFERLGQQPLVTSDPRRIAEAERVVLPGVGAAGYAMQQIDSLGLRPLLPKLRQPVLGICLGMQLLFERSDEADTICLGIIAGSVRGIDPAPGRPVPHMGWSRLTVVDPDIGLADGDYVYFAHSFACDTGAATAATADYGAAVTAAVRQGNFWGAQFHPERSGAAGARFLTAWLQA